MPTFGSLFAGIGGIDLGLERAGWTCRWQVEYDPFCQRVLAKHWPDVARYGDITGIDWSTVEPVDLLAGGFPCQPVSVAGKQLAQADERWLWPEFARAVRDLRPRLVLVENVPGLLAHGMGDVLGDLAAAGYDAEWRIVSAASVGAPHLRERVWITAHADSRRDDRRGPVTGDGRSLPTQGLLGLLRGGDGREGAVPDPLGADLRVQPVPVGWRCGPTLAGNDGAAEPLADAAGERGAAGLAGPLPWQAGLRGEPEHEGAPGGGSDGRVGPDEWWATEPDVGRVAHGVPARAHGGRR